MTKSTSNWESLISRSNWEKGAIIDEWLSESEGNTHEGFAHKVGGITTDHCVKLHRVWESYSSVMEGFDNLHWTHFLAVMEWESPMEWLAQASDSGWSVTELRMQHMASQGVSTEESARLLFGIVGQLRARWEDDIQAASESGRTTDASAKIQVLDQIMSEYARESQQAAE